MLHLPCSLHSKRHHEDAHPAETHWERRQVPLPPLWHSYRPQEWLGYVYLNARLLLLLLTALHLYPVPFWFIVFAIFQDAHPPVSLFLARGSSAQATLVYRDGQEVSLLWRPLPRALRPNPAPEVPQEREALQVWHVWLLLSTGAAHGDAPPHTHRREALRLQPVWEDFQAEAAAGHALQALPRPQLCSHHLRLP